MGRVNALDIEGGVFFGKTQLLCVAKGIPEGDPVIGHFRKYVIACPIQNTEHIRNPVPDKAVPYGPDNRNAAAHGCLKTYLTTVLPCDLKELVPPFSEQRLVGGNNPFFLFQRLNNIVVGRPDAAYQFHNNVYACIVQDLKGVACDEASGDLFALYVSRVCFGYPDNLDVQSCLLLYQGFMFSQDPVCTGTYCTETYNADANHLLFDEYKRFLIPLIACLILCSFSIRANRT